MKREEFEDLEDKLMREVVRRRNLGTYNQDAPTILMLTETIYELVRHFREKAPASPKKKEGG